VTRDILTDLLFAAGVAQLGVLVASAIVPFRLNWRTELGSLSRLHRQMYWVYGGYVVLSIVSFALLSLFNARELAQGSGLAKGVCLYIAVFWGVRVALQGVFDVKEHLNAWWLRAGYIALTLLFAALTIVYAWAAVGPVH
jgi:hypothetical protein